MNQNQFLVVQWWHTKRDYNLGILLLSKFCRNKILANSISKKSEKFGRAKLEYELPKSVGLNHLDMPDYNAEDGPADEDDSELVGLVSTPSIKRKEDITSFPNVIKRLKHEYSEMYNARSMVHKSLLKVPEVNNPLNNEKRAGFLEEMKTLSARMELFHMHINAWETDKTIPDEEIFWPGVKKKIALL